MPRRGRTGTSAAPAGPRSAGHEDRGQPLNLPSPEALGVGAALLSSALWAWASTRFTPLIRNHGPFAVNLFKTIGGAALFWLTTAILSLSGSDVFAGCTPEMAGLLIASGLIGLAFGDYCLLAAIDRVGVRQATLLHATAPLWLLFLNLAGAGQPLRGIQVTGILLVVIGVMDVTRRRTRGAGTDSRRVRGGIILGLLAAVAQAVAIQISKGPTVACESAAVVSAVRLTGAIVGLVVVAAGTRQIGAFMGLVTDRRDRQRALGPVFFGTFLGVLCMTVAIDASHEAVAGALLSLTPVFAVPISRLVLGEPMRWQTLIGTCVAAGGVAMISLG
ncbi:MAG: DMT family transporter [Planctomycetota bacterium]|nr:DMT family transporter [Planctomycetota bacterium]